jgi:hypothetical protein
VACHPGASWPWRQAGGCALAPASLRRGHDRQQTLHTPHALGCAANANLELRLAIGAFVSWLSAALTPKSACRNVDQHMPPGGSSTWPRRIRFLAVAVRYAAAGADAINAMPSLWGRHLCTCGTGFADKHPGLAARNRARQAAHDPGRAVI